MKAKNTSAWIVALTLALPACADAPVEDEPLLEEDPIEAVEAVTPTAGDEVTVADVAGDPAQYIGRTVTVEGDLEEVLGPLAFTLDEDAITEAGIDNDLLVVGAQTANLAMIDDQWLNNRVRVTGTVQIRTVVELERELGWDLDPELEAEVEGREGIIIATSVERVN